MPGNARQDFPGHLRDRKQLRGLSGTFPGTFPATVPGTVPGTVPVTRKRLPGALAAFRGMLPVWARLPNAPGGAAISQDICRQGARMRSHRKAKKPQDGRSAL